MSKSTKKRLKLPTPAQIKWSDAEIGVIIHLDVQVFEPGYKFRNSFGYSPDPKVFNPENLDTDQWIETAKSLGATYAVLVAKHCSGFSLWPTRAHDYSVASSPWKNGKGDIVADFFASCRKYGLKPGLYCSASVNAYMNVDIPGRVRSGELKEQDAYNRLVETQLSELWTNYGEIFEIWFDGGVILPEEGGPNIESLLQKLQPNAVIFQGPKNSSSLLRWIGNERGVAPDPCWSVTNQTTSEDGTMEKIDLGGNPDGDFWAPGEADMPNRNQTKAFQGGWFWREGDDQYLYSLDHLTECYFSSVGRNTNFLLGMVIDNRGMVPEADQKQFDGLGKRIRDIFSNRIASSSGTGDNHIFDIPKGKKVNMIVLQEDIEHGERVRKYVVEAEVQGSWLEVYRGSCIGHKRIERFSAVDASKLRMRIIESVGVPLIREFSAWDIDPAYSISAQE